jgi:membrane-associated phospholipid phosphatase
MENQNNLQHQNYYRNTIASFIIPCIVLMLLHLIIGPVSCVVLINGTHNEILDYLFKYITYLGDGIILVPLAIGMLFRGLFFSVSFIVAAILQGTILIFCKKFLFHASARPIHYLNYESVHFVPGVIVHHWNTFPSGHTTTAFGMIILLALASNNILNSRFLLIIAMLVGISRIYLLQHFALDVAIGGLIGIGTSLLSYYWFISNPNKPNWMEKRIRIVKGRKLIRIAIA